MRRRHNTGDSESLLSISPSHEKIITALTEKILGKFLGSLGTSLAAGARGISRPMLAAGSSNEGAGRAITGSLGTSGKRPEERGYACVQSLTELTSRRRARKGHRQPQSTRKALKRATVKRFLLRTHSRWPFAHLLPESRVLTTLTFFFTNGSTPHALHHQ